MINRESNGQVNFVSDYKSIENNKKRYQLNEEQRERFRKFLEEWRTSGIQIDSLESNTQKKRRLLKEYLPAKFGESGIEHIDRMQPLYVGVYFRDAILHPQHYFEYIQFETHKDKYGRGYEGGVQSKNRIIRLRESKIEYPIDPKKEFTISPLESSMTEDGYKISSVHRTSEGGDVVNYQYTKPKDIVLEKFLVVMTEVMALYDTICTNRQNPAAQLYRNVDEFINRHTGRSYRDRLNEIDFDTIAENDFRLVQKRGIKKRLFDYRAKMYIAALATLEEQGYDIEEALKKISELRIYPIKKEKTEPTFEWLRHLLTTK